MNAVTFDFGHTLADIDHELLAARVAERGARVDPKSTRRETRHAWHAYAEAKRAGDEGEAAWGAFMRTLLERAGLEPQAGGPSSGKLAEEISRWLFREQPRKNLWRRPIPEMLELCKELAARGVPIGIVSNAEGGLRDLLAELGWLSLFRSVADSGRLGFEKPDTRIFEWAAAELGARLERLIHVGDSWVADVEGARAAGARAIWFLGGEAPYLERPSDGLPDGVVSCIDAAAVRQALHEWGV
jgi:putative hydrolase of the HAD superfamily